MLQELLEMLFYVLLSEIRRRLAGLQSALWVIDADIEMIRRRAVEPEWVN